MATFDTEKSEKSPSIGASSVESVDLGVVENKGSQAIPTTSLCSLRLRQAERYLKNTDTRNYRIPFDLRAVPVARYYVHRAAELQDIESILLISRRNRNHRKTYVLHGLGGCGKTQLAVRFARKHQSSFTSTFWIDCSTKSRLQQSFNNIQLQLFSFNAVQGVGTSDATRKDIHPSIQNVLNWLEQPRNKNWLLIFDNVDQDAYDVTECFPYSDHGSILITTRLYMPQRKDRKIRRLSEMTRGQGRQLLENKLGNRIAHMDDIVKELAGLPLALEEAALFIRENNASAFSYLQRYRSMDKHAWDKLFEKGTVLDGYPGRSLASTWTSSYRQIEKTDPGATELLRLFSCLHHWDIEYDLFIPLLQGLDTMRFEKPQWLTDMMNPNTFKRCIKTLRDFSMVTAQGDSFGISVHPVTQNWCFHEAEDQIDIYLTFAILAIGYAAPDINKHQSWRIRRRLVPHADRISTILKVPARIVAVVPDLEESIHLCLQRLGNLYRDEGSLSEAATIYQLLLQRKEKFLGEDDVSTLDTVAKLGNIYADQDRLDDAETLLQRAFKKFKNIYGLKSEFTINTISNLGSLYRAQGKLAEAERMHKQALEGYYTIRGPDFFLVFNTLNNLGNVYVDQEKLEEAEEKYLEALEGYNRLLEPDNVLTINVIYNIARLYNKQRKRVEAKRMYQRALKGYKISLGPDHPDTLAVGERIRTLGKRRDSFLGNLGARVRSMLHIS